MDRVNVQCFLSQVCISLTVYQRCTRSDFEGQHTNAIYVINCDSQNTFTFVSTNFFFLPNSKRTSSLDANSHKELFRLDMALLKSNAPSAIPWVDVQTLNFTSGKHTDSYQPVMALAQNHIHLLGVPGIPAGETQFVVIHCTYLFSFSCSPLIYKNRRIHATGFSNVHRNQVSDDARPYGELLQRDRPKLRLFCVGQLSRSLVATNGIRIHPKRWFGYLLRPTPSSCQVLSHMATRLTVDRPTQHKLLRAQRSKTPQQHTPHPHTHSSSFPPRA